MKLAKVVKPLLAVAVVGGLGFGVFRYLTASAEAPEQVPTYTVTRGTLARVVVAEGNLRALKATPLTVPRTTNEGAMKVAWLAGDGTHVKANDVVVKFDRSDSEKRLTDGKADLDSAQARRTVEEIRGRAAVEARDDAAALAGKELDQARQFQAKDRDIYSKHQIIESEIDQTLAGAKQQHAEKTKKIERDLSHSKAALISVEEQKAQLAIKNATKALESMEVRAPHDGIFVLQRNWRGEMPKVGEQMWPGQPVGEIPLLDTMEVEVFVLEIDGAGLGQGGGQRAEITIEARPDVVYQGKVRLVDKLAKPRVPGVPIQYFAVVVALDHTDKVVMKPGQRVRAKLLLDDAGKPTAADALIVPRQAVINKDGKNYVYRRGSSGEFEQVPVELGAATSGRVVIAKGLAEGDQIALRDPTRSVDQALKAGSGDKGPSAGGGGEDKGVIIIE